MLKYRLNTKNAIENIVDIELYSGDSESIIEKDNVLYLKITSPKINVGDTLFFSRNEPDDIYFYEEKSVIGVEDVYEDEEYKYTEVKFFSFTPKTHKMPYISEFDLKYHPTETNVKKFIQFTTENEHDMILNRTFNSKGKPFYVSEIIFGEYDVNEDDFGKKRCTGDLIVYNSVFLYEATDVNEHNKYTFNEGFLNKKDSVIVIYVNNDFENEFIGLNIGESGSNWEYKGKRLYLYNCITPSNEITGKDNKNNLLWEATNFQLASLLKKYWLELVYYVVDDRFYKKEEGENDVYYCILNESTKINKKNYHIAISQAFIENFDIKLSQEDTLGNVFAKNIAEKSKNEIIDYEKQIFEPVIVGDNGFKNAEKIEINLNFRDRGGDYEQWKTNDDLYWNGYNKRKKLLNGNSDLLGQLGFTDDDVYYSKKKLSRSFLRLSFFDSKSRLNQNLLFTSTIYLKEHELYGKYLKNLKNNIKKDENGYVFTDNTPFRLDSTIACYGKYGNALSQGTENTSSEGFYLYLFPSLVESNKEESEIYLKVEFNHAKYGYKIPFIMPYKTVDEKEVSIKPDDSEFPLNYEKEKDGKRYIDTLKLFDDMYVTVKIKYDKERGKYIWWIPRQDSNNGIITLDFFEPKINKGSNDD